MPRSHRRSLPSRYMSRPAAPVPQRYLWWMEISGLESALACRLWDAMARSGHPTAQRLRWFFTKLERKPVRDIAAQMLALHARISTRVWVEMLEDGVRRALLTRQEATAIEDALLAWTGADGGWRSIPQVDP